MVFTLIGDVVGSRALPDRAAAQESLNEALDRVTARFAVAQPLEPTVGDEVQGAFHTLGHAVSASLQLRLELLPHIDVRCGLGQGEVTVHDRRRKPLLQDGPGWWSARSALDELGKRARSAERTLYAGPGAAHVNAYLLTRDALVARLSDGHRRWLLLALVGLSQADIASQEGVSRSAVSQAYAKGVGALRDAARVFETTEQW